MAILQALLGLLSRALGKVITALFGWSVVALFGQTTDTQKTFLSVLVGAAVLWPLLLVGIAFPGAAAFLIAFVPMHAAIPDLVLRVLWLSLAILIPAAMGIVVAAKAPPGTPAEPVWRRILRGFPITVALAASFLITFVTAPLMRIVNIARRREDVSVPAITDAAGYHELAAAVVGTLASHGFQLQRGQPPRSVTLPSRVLLELGGKAFRGYIPQDLQHYESQGLELTFYPSGVLMRGAHRQTLRAHALVDERIASTPAVQTTNPHSQELERQIRRVWAVFSQNPAAHANSRILLGRLDEITADARKLDLAYADWQVLYRQLLQLGRSLRGDEPLVAKVDRQVEQAHKAPDGLVAKAAWLAKRAVSTI
jgi:hypothetical protein